MRTLLSSIAAVATLAVPMAAAAPAHAYTKSALRPPGSAILTDSEAAAKVARTAWEPRPDNATENRTIPTATQLTTFRSYTGQWGNCDHLRAKVTGNFTGTTDDIIEWAAWKWGLPEDALRAVAVTESWWRMETVGDNGTSYGLTQIKNVSKWHGGTYPISKDATAFSVDYHAGMVRHYFEGCATWLKDYSFHGYTYAKGDLWGSIGAWYSGNWHSDASHSYVTKVKRHLRDRTWKKAGF